MNVAVPDISEYLQLFIFAHICTRFIACMWHYMMCDRLKQISFGFIILH